MSALWIWLALAVMCVVAEVLTVNLIFIMLAAGAAVAAVSDLLGASTPIQILIAAVVSVPGLLIFRPLTLRHLQRRQGDCATSIDALLGKPARVTTTVTSTSGAAMINGGQWSARMCANEDPLPEGTTGIVKRIDGAYLVLTHAPAEA